jgi:hypothetical protein
MFQMACPMDCGKVLESEDKDGILKVYDKHVAEKHQASPAQWLEAHRRIEAGKERAKKAGSVKATESR